MDQLEQDKLFVSLPESKLEETTAVTEEALRDALEKGGKERRAVEQMMHAPSPSLVVMFR